MISFIDYTALTINNAFLFWFRLTSHRLSLISLIYVMLITFAGHFSIASRTLLSSPSFITSWKAITFLSMSLKWSGAIRVHYPHPIQKSCLMWIPPFTTLSSVLSCGRSSFFINFDIMNPIMKMEIVVKIHRIIINFGLKNFASFKSMGTLITAHVLSITTILEILAPFSRRALQSTHHWLFKISILFTKFLYNHTYHIKKGIVRETWNTTFLLKQRTAENEKKRRAWI